MNRIKRKLNNNDGVTLLISLVGFLVACMISIVLITAAVSSANRVANDRDENQAHLTLSSAAQVLRDEMEATTCILTKDNSTGKYKFESSSGTFASEMEKAVEFLIRNNYTSDYASTNKSAAPATYSDFTISLDPSSDAVKQVNVTFIMDTQYNLTFTLSIDKSDREIFLKMSGKCEKKNNLSGKYTLSWSTISINELGD